MHDFNHKRVVIVSVALAGEAYIPGRALHLGAACAHDFAKHGAHVIVLDPNHVALELLRDEIRSKGGSIDVMTVDIHDRDALQRAANEIEEKWSSVHALVNAHLETEVGTIATSDEQFWIRGVQMNLLSPVFAAQAFLNALKASGQAAIVNLGSIDGMQGNPRLPAYSVAKGGIIPLTHLMANEFAEFGIRVNCVARGMYIERGEAVSPKFEPLIQQTPLARPAYADEVANAVRYLSSEQASYISGVVLPVDGGRTCITPGTRWMSS